MFFLFLVGFYASTFANQNNGNVSESEYKKAKKLVDSINYYFDKDQEKYNNYADLFNAIEFKNLIDSNFRQAIFDRAEFLRRNYKYEEAIPILNHAILIAKDNKDTLSMAFFHKTLSTHYFYTDNYDSTYSQLDKAYTLYDHLNNKAELGVINIRRARIEYNLGNYENALKFSFKALELQKSSGDQNKMAISYLQLGNTYFYLSKYRDSKKYYELASVLFKYNENEYGFYEAFSNIGLVEITEKEYRKGMSKQFAVLEYLLRENYSIASGVTYNFLVDAYFGLQLYDSSIYYNELAKKEFLKSNFQQGLCQSFLNEAKVFFVENQFNKALKSAQKCYDIAFKNSYYELLEEANFELYKIHKKLNNQSKSYLHLEEYVKIKDSLNFNPYALQSDAMKYQLAAEEAQLKQQIAEERAQIQAENGEETRKQLVIALIISTITLISFFVSIYYLSKNRKLNKSLSLQREQISEELKVKASLLSEIHHRVKNNLQVISSMLSLQTQYIADNSLKKIIEDCKGRITSMSLIHESLYRKQDFKDALFSSYIEELLPRLVDTYGTDESKVQLMMDLEPIKLSLDDSIPCGLIINEIISNSLKHAFPKGREGIIRIELKQKEESVYLTISDDGIGLKEDKTFKGNESFGFLLIETLANQLEAEIAISTLSGFSYHLKWENKAESVES